MQSEKREGKIQLKSTCVKNQKNIKKMIQYVHCPACLIFICVCTECTYFLQKLLLLPYSMCTQDYTAARRKNICKKAPCVFGQEKKNQVVKILHTECLYKLRASLCTNHVQVFLEIFCDFQENGIFFHYLIPKCQAKRNVLNCIKF